MFLQILAKKKGLEWKKFRRLGDVHAALGVNIEDMVTLVSEIFHKHSYSKQEICDILEVTEDELNNLSLSERTYAGE